MTSTESAEELPLAQALAVRLVVYPARGPAFVHWHRRGNLDVGRREPVGLLVDDRRVSTRHARMRWSSAQQRLEIRDLGSKNGTFVDGQRVMSAVLEPGAVVRLGDSLLTAEVGVLRRGDRADRSLAMALLESRVEAVAGTELTVLITGPPGSGKTWLAQQIWRRSARRDRPFEDISCAELQEALLESHLFGHVRGAFTGADSASLGLVRSVEGGTVFLDEIGTAPPGVQAKLLRVLDKREVRPLGSARSYPVDVRFLAATNADLEAAVARGDFRSDLYHRLAETSLELAPIRLRRPDILPRLLEAIEQQGRTEDLGRAHRRFAPNALEALLVYEWPGNVREIATTARMLLGGPGLIAFEQLPEPVQAHLRARRDDGGQDAEGDRSQAPPLEVLEAQFEAVGRSIAALVREHYPDRHYTTVRGWLIHRGLKTGKR